MQNKNQKEIVKSLQVLVIAENYTDTQSNFSLSPCPIECPLEKTLQLLERHEFKDIIVFTSSHRREIEGFLNSRKKKQGVSVRFLYGEGCRSFGDICRSIFNQKIIKEDFLIINGNTISDVNLNYLYKKYKLVSSKEKGMIMFKVFKKKPLHSQNNSFVLYDKNTNLIHYYEKFILDQKNKQFKIKENYRFPFKKIFKEQNKEQYTLAFDLIDTQITFCSNGILNTFNENFDHHSLRDHFIKEVLSSEISTEKIGITIIDETKCFHQVCDNPYDFYRCILLQIKQAYTYFYVDNKDYDTSQFCKIISRQIKIDFSSQFEDFIFLGKNCEIGKKVQIKNSILQDECVIGDNCIIENCFLSAQCQIEQNSQLKNCYIMGKVVIKENEVKINQIFNGERWIDVNQGTEQQESLIDDNSYCLDSDEEDSKNENNFQKEIEETIEVLKNDPEATPSVSLELMNIKLSENKTFGECVEAMLICILEQNIDKDASNILTSLKKLKLYTELLLQYVKGEAEMRALTNTLENFIKENQDLKIHLFLQHFYQEEILSSEFLIEWGEQKKNSEDEFNEHCYKLMQKFLEWLEEESEEESEDESDEESEEGNQNFYFLQCKRMVGIISPKFGFIFHRFCFYSYLSMRSLSQPQTQESQLKEFVLFYLQSKLLFVNQNSELLLITSLI